jgi:actin cytoskeleton-regulatory complex protein SLA1
VGFTNIQTPVQKWQTAEISNMSIEKSKHVYIDVDGSSPIQLHFNAGSKDVADAIVAKLESSREFAGGPPASPTASSSTRRLPPLRTISPKNGKLQKKPGASVHFSPASPVVIPPRESSEDEEHEEHEPEVNGYEPAEDSQAAIALYDFDADGDDELSVKAGEELVILERDGDEWWKCRNAHGGEGVVPASYLEVSWA